MWLLHSLKVNCLPGSCEISKECYTVYLCGDCVYFKKTVLVFGVHII